LVASALFCTVATLLPAALEDGCELDADGAGSLFADAVAGGKGALGIADALAITAGLAAAWVVGGGAATGSGGAEVPNNWSRNVTIPATAAAAAMTKKMAVPAPPFFFAVGADARATADAGRTLVGVSRVPLGAADGVDERLS
jgi:hypothetical protein